MESLWEYAVKEASQAGVPNSGTGERCLVFAGSKASGKSSIIQRFLDKNEPIKETLAMEYTFGRKSGKSLAKDVCHIWELGGGTLFANLITAPFTNAREGPVVRSLCRYGRSCKLNILLPRPLRIPFTDSFVNVANQEITFILVLDLSNLNSMWETLDTLTQRVYNHLKRAGNIDQLVEEARGRLNIDHEDLKLVHPYPVPLVIVGAKYDLFQDIDPEKKKAVCRTLRQVAHYLAASLVFYTDRDPTLVKKFKEVLNHHGFGGSQWKGFSVDHNKPVCVPAGVDSFQQIGLAGVALSTVSDSFSLDKFKHAFTTHFPQDANNEVVAVDDPAKDHNYKEPIIDSLRSQKDEELDRLCQDMETRKRLATLI